MTRRKQLPILTRAESEIMAVLWRNERGTVHDVARALERVVAYNTVLTMLRILEEKGYVTHEPNPAGGRSFVYRPTAPKSKARRSHVRDLIDRLFDGHPEELASGLIDDEGLSDVQLRA